MMRQVTSGDFCISSRPSCLAEDGHHPASHFELCTSQPSKFYPPPPPSALQMTLAPMVLPTQSHKPMVCQRQELLGVDGRSSVKIPSIKSSAQTPEEGKKSKATGKTGRRGRPLGTTKLAGYRTSTGDRSALPELPGSRQAQEGRWARPERRGTRSAPGDLLGASKASLALTNWLMVAPAAEQLFPYPIAHKEILCEASCKEKTANEQTLDSVSTLPP